MNGYSNYLTIETSTAGRVEKRDLKDRPSLETIRACDGLQDLQQYELNAIYRRLEVLYAATDYFNVDYKYFKEVNYSSSY